MTQYARSSVHESLMPQDDNDDIIVPSLLSVLAHALLIGFIIYTHKTPELDNTPSIEATMISPEQLADMQGQILANRAALAESGAASAGDPEFTPTLPSDQLTPSSQATSSATSGARPSKSVPIFTHSDDPADAPIEDGLLLSAEQKQALQDKREAYRREVEKAATMFDEQINQEQTSVAEAERQKERERIQRLEELKAIQSKGPMIPRPKSSASKAGNKGSSSTTNINLADGDPLYTGKSSGSSSDSAKGGGSSGRSGKSYTNGIVSAIQSRFVAPYNSEGDFANLSLRLDTNGNVLSASASGSNPAVNAAAEAAAYAASPLPIDLSNPQAFASITVKIRGS